jgi:membrane-associated protein
VEQTPATEHPAYLWLRRNLTVIVAVVTIALILIPRLLPLEGLSQNLNVIDRVGEWMIAKLERLFSQYGYWLVFFGTLAENSLFLGLLVPGSVILILAGLSAQNGLIDLWLVLGLATLGTIIGDTASYGIGRLGWTRLLERAGLGNALAKAHRIMDSNRTWIILGYHFAGYTRVVGPTAAGLFKIEFRKWAPLDYIGAAAWVFAFTMLGYMLGVAGLEFGDSKRMVEVLEWVLLAVLAAVVGYAIWRARRSRRRDNGPSVASSGAGQPAMVIVSVDDEE